MINRLALLALTPLVIAAIPGVTTTAFPSSADGIDRSGAVQEPECVVSDNMAVEGRASPLDSASVALADGVVKVCFGSPAARGRTMLGGEFVPFGELWRTGANEPTMVHTTVPLSIAGVQLAPGSYSLYTVPGEDEWEVFLSLSIDHWGLQITPEVREMEVGSATIEPAQSAEPVESMVFRFEDAGTRGATLVLEWENTRLEIPVTATGN